MIPLRLSLITLPAAVWTRLPQDRPLAALAADALGSARRIRKGSNARRERVRFTQLCSYIESAALELLRQSGTSAAPLAGLLALHWQDAGADGRVSAYLDLTERLASQELEALPSPGVWRCCWHFAGAVFANLHPAWLALLPRRDAREAWSRIALAWASLRGAMRGKGETLGPLVQGMTFHTPGVAVAAQRRLHERLTLETLVDMFPKLNESRRETFARLAWEKAQVLRAAEKAGAAVVEVLVALPE